MNGFFGKKNYKTTVVFTVIAAGISVLAWVIHDQNPLSWSNERIGSSPKNLTLFLKTGLREINKEIPDDFIFRSYPTSVNRQLMERASSSNLLDSLSLEAFNVNLDKKIRQGKKFILLPDHHSVTEIVEDDSDKAQTKRRQEEIVAYIKSSPCTLIFGEGFDFKVGWDNCLAAINDEFAKMNLPLVDKKNMKQTIMLDPCWWQYFMDDSSRTIIGIDAPSVNSLVIILSEITQSGLPEKTKILANRIHDYLNFSFREPLIISRMIREMEKNKKQEALVVIGAFHAYTFPGICQYWGIGLQIVDFNKQ